MQFGEAKADLPMHPAFHTQQYLLHQQSHYHLGQGQPMKARSVKLNSKHLLQGYVLLKNDHSGSGIHSNLQQSTADNRIFHGYPHKMHLIHQATLENVKYLL